MDREGGSDVGSYCYYSVLGIRKDASFSDIRSAYRKLALIGGRRTPPPPEKPNAAFRKSKKPTQGKRSMYDAGFLDLFEEDEGMGDFLHDLMNMMEQQNVGAEKEESIEDLQKTFVELFGEDLADMMMIQESEEPTVRKNSGSSNTRVTPRRNTHL
ncbi:hypothetical protein Sango_0679000 [Sesamum angolense]|uniref:J domain-containing protein n=1 Tax=Sesamum angolense TaxID=2727404 RepID=A0AAE1X7P1_9LAMI|nr:hypothetical protein Sango_0679000 [Sesamum angolense]